MLSIRRDCAQKIITKALGKEAEPLLGIIQRDGSDYTFCNDQDSLKQLVESNSGAMVLHNQNQTAIDSVGIFERDDDQIIVEIRQDTKGVLGLEARRHEQGSLILIDMIYSD